MVDIRDISFRMALRDEYKKKCFYCQELISSIDNMQVDHIVYKDIVKDLKKFKEVKETLGLEENFDINDYKNLVPTHAGCNRRKWNRIYHKRAMITFLEEAKKKAPLVKIRQEKLIQSITLSELESYAGISIPKVKDLDSLAESKKKIIEHYEQAKYLLSKGQEQLQRVSFSRSLEKDELRYKQNVSGFSPESLLIEMDTPINNRLISSELYIKIIKSSNREEAMDMIKRMLSYCYERPHAIFRVSSLNVLLSLYEGRLEILSDTDLNYLKDNIENLSLCNLNYWSHDNVQNALCHYENITLRLSKLFSMKFYMDKAINAIELFNKKFEEKKINVLGYTPDVAEILLYFINFFADSFWRDFSESLTSEDIWQGFWLCQYAIKLVAKYSFLTYPESQGDLTNFENYGGTFDMYCYGTWYVLRRHAKILSSFDFQLMDFSKLSHNDIRFKIQRWKNRPQEWTPPLREYKDTKIVELIKLLEQ